jgi:FixJ family two-component response regulator
VSNYKQGSYDYFNKPVRKVGRLSQLGKANRNAKKRIGDSEMVRAAKASDARAGYLFDSGL